MKSQITFALVALTAILAGCSSPSSEDASDSTDDAVKASTHPSALVGTWESSGTDELLWYSFTFKSSGTYSATGGCKPNPKGPSCFAISESSGKWKVQKSGPQLGDPAGASEIVLTDSFDQTTTYFYSEKSDVLSLTETYDGTVSKFDKN